MDVNMVFFVHDDASGYIESEEESTPSSGNHKQRNEIHNYTLVEKFSSFKNKKVARPISADGGITTFHCQECDKKFIEKLQLSRHMEKHSDKLFRCEECGKAFHQNGHLIRHQVGHTGEKPFNCTECGQKFTQESALKRHQRSHGRDKGSDRGKGTHLCTECGKYFSGLTSLKRHSVLHSGEKQYLDCKVCGKTFAHSSSLQRHQSIQHEPKILHYQDGGKESSEESELIVHQRQHTGMKLYHCDICGKGFTRHYNLISHQRVHCEEKPYHCQECGQDFREKSMFLQHQCLHSGKEQDHCAIRGSACSTKDSDANLQSTCADSSYHCGICNVNFAQKLYLRQHQHRVHVARQCDEVLKKRSDLTAPRQNEAKVSQHIESSKKFTPKSKLIKHQDKVKLKKPSKFLGKKLPYQCDVCGDKFKASNSLACHKLWHEDMESSESEDSDKHYEREG